MTLVTSYEYPDLDGFACSLGYAQFLTAKGSPAQAVVFGKTDTETNFVLERFGMSENLSSWIDQDPTGSAIEGDIILVDASDAEAISPLINRNRVVEIIDHRTLVFLKMFPNAKAQIELVGSCATLIAEKYHAGSVMPSKELAALLYSAIISNTVNFKNTVTTDRDRAMARWLAPMLELPDSYIHDMFVAKSKIDNLEEVLENECAVYEFEGKRSSIFQLELVDAEPFVANNRGVIESTMERLKQSKQLDLTFLSVIDVEAAYNLFVTIDENSQQMLEKILGLHFNNGRTKREGIIMRKQLFPMVKDYILNNNVILA